MKRSFSIIIIVCLCLGLGFIFFQWSTKDCIPSEIKSLHEQALTLFDQWAYTGSLEIFEQILQTHPEVKEIYYNKGLIYNHLWDYEQALASFDEALMIDPRYVDALREKAKIFYEMGSFDDALEVLNILLEINPDDIHALHDQWFIRYQMGSYDFALEYYDLALAQDPQFVEALVNKWVVIADMGRLEESLSYFDQAIAIDSWNASYYYNKATILSDLWYQIKHQQWADINWKGDMYAQQALDLFNKTLLLDPDHIDALVYKAITYYDMENYLLCLETTQKAIQKNPQHENAWYYQAKALAALGRKEEAIKAYQQVLLLNQYNAYAEMELEEIKNKPKNIEYKM